MKRQHDGSRGLSATCYRLASSVPLYNFPHNRPYHINTFSTGPHGADGQEDRWVRHPGSAHKHMSSWPTKSRLNHRSLTARVSLCGCMFQLCGIICRGYGGGPPPRCFLSGCSGFLAFYLSYLYIFIDNHLRTRTSTEVSMSVLMMGGRPLISMDHRPSGKRLARVPS